MDEKTPPDLPTLGDDIASVLIEKTRPWGEIGDLEGTDYFDKEREKRRR